VTPSDRAETNQLFGENLRPALSAGFAEELLNFPQLHDVMYQKTVIGY
jgi:hypothetical protein